MATATQLRTLFPLLAGCLLLALAPGSVGATTFGNLKTPQQFRADAARYDESVKAIHSIASMRIATRTELDAAMAILQKHSPNLTLGASRLVALGYDDRRFATAIAANLTDPRKAQDFARRLAADHTIAARLDGATELKARMGALVKANAAILQRAIEHLQAATLRITGKSPGVRPKFFAPPSSTLWTPASNAVLAAIAFTFPSIAANAPVLKQYGTDISYTDRSLPTAEAIAAWMATVGLYGSEEDLKEMLASLSLQIEFYDDVRETAAAAYRAAINSCVERMRVVLEQCLAAIPASSPADYEAAKSACELGFQIDQSWCRINPSHDFANGSLFQTSD